MPVASCVPASLEAPLPSLCSFLWGAVEVQFCSSDILSFSSERQIAWQVSRLEVFAKQFPLTLLGKNNPKLSYFLNTIIIPQACRKAVLLHFNV